MVNATYDTLLYYLTKGMIGLHTMTDEHFGISIIEYMVSGLIPIAHNSAGPKMDILQNFNDKPVGYLAQTMEEYADRMNEILKMSSRERKEIQTSARNCVLERFSEVSFSEVFLAAMERISLGLTEEK